MDVVEKAVELLTDSPFADLTLTPEQASTVVRREKAERAFPTAYRPGPDYSDVLGPAVCDCPACRRARGEAVGPDEDEEEDYGYNEFDEILDRGGIPPDMPPEVARVLFEETRRAAERGESLGSLLNRLFGSEAGFGRGSRKGRRR
jgi:hypothetical protein